MPNRRRGAAPRSSAAVAVSSLNFCRRPSPCGREVHRTRTEPSRGIEWFERLSRVSAFQVVAPISQQSLDDSTPGERRGRLPSSCRRLPLSLLLQGHGRDAEPSRPGPDLDGNRSTLRLLPCCPIVSTSSILFCALSTTLLPYCTVALRAMLPPLPNTDTLRRLADDSCWPGTCAAPNDRQSWSHDKQVR
jgi:hypothetical protein